MPNDDIKRNIIVLPVAAFVISLGFGIPALLVLYLLLALDGLITELPENLGKIPTVPEIAIQYTLLMSAFMLTRALFAGYFGSLSDRIGRKKLINIGFLIYTVVTYGYIIATEWWHLLIVRIIQGVASAMVWPVAEALIMDSVSWGKRGRIMGIYMTTTNLGFIIGPAFGALVYKIIVNCFRPSLLDSFRLPFYVLMFMSLISTVITLFIVDTIPHAERRVPRRGPLNPVKTISVELSDKLRRSISVLYLMGLANGFAMGFVAPISSLFIAHYITSDPVILGSLATMAGMLGLAASYPAGRLSDIIGRKKIVVVGQLSTRFLTFYLPFVRKVDELFIVYVTRSIAFNVMSPAFRALQADLVPQRLRGKIFGNVQALFNFGAAFAPLGGYLYWKLSEWSIEFLNYTLPGVALIFWISAIIGFMTTIMFILWVYEPEKTEKEIIAEA